MYRTLKPNSQRPHISSVINPRIINDISRNIHTVHTVRNVRDHANIDMSGEGISDTLKYFYEKGKQGVKFIFDNRGKIVDSYTGEVGTAIRNALPDSDETARNGFAGEKHAILQLKNGKYGVANYMGPDTALLERLNRGDPPRTAVDKVSMYHDVRYALAKTPDDIRRADNIMLKKVDEIERNRGDAPKNIMQAKLIRAKVIGEDLSLLKKDAFSGDLSKHVLSDSNKSYLQSKLNQGAQEGYGLGLPGMGLSLAGGNLPGDELKMKILRKMKKDKKRSKSLKLTGLSVTKDLGKSYVLGGDGLKLAGQGLKSYRGSGELTSFVVDTIIPKIMKAVGIPGSAVPKATLTNIIDKALSMIPSQSSNNIPSIVAQLSKTILPILTGLKLKQSGMGGSGVLDLLKKAKDSLTVGLARFVWGIMKGDLNRHYKSKGVESPFGGDGIMTGGFNWKAALEGFKTGFLKVFKPGSKILGMAATALGQPEIGIPLTAISNML